MTHQECTCLSKFNEMLKKHNTEIDVTFTIPRDGGPMRALPKIATSKIETRKRVGPVIAAPTFCPFCGQRYAPQPAKPAEADIYQRLIDASVRIEGMWPFPVSPAPEAIAEIFEYADEHEDFPEPLRALVSSLDERTKDDLYKGGQADWDMAFDELCAAAARKHISGWIGIAANPMMKPLGGGGGVQFSWGHYQTKVMFAEHAEQLLRNAAKWGETNFMIASAPEGGAA
ncbi:hypothetical protein [Novosphingobium sp. ST904]|uniref:hypothetical protein n=1 Tax=Novosphingobium sp. ST904 TaxID=1684385 RepID=UPI0006C88BFE|nr:hypothetical protein [Novosphingobium sp. ST904]KPH62306.1 hypothetical protein ADT71_15300 [Novosphingobium sp. ST904]TCM43357.1 hypothetical protein EDF59_101461 [Novosphingobium sp. ST904]